MVRLIICILLIDLRYKGVYFFKRIVFFVRYSFFFVLELSNGNFKYIAEFLLEAVFNKIIQEGINIVVGEFQEDGKRKCQVNDCYNFIVINDIYLGQSI